MEYAQMQQIIASRRAYIAAEEQERRRYYLESEALRKRIKTMPRSPEVIAYCEALRAKYGRRT